MKMKFVLLLVAIILTSSVTNGLGRSKSKVLSHAKHHPRKVKSHPLPLEDEAHIQKIVEEYKEMQEEQVEEAKISPLQENPQDFEILTTNGQPGDKVWPTQKNPNAEAYYDPSTVDSDLLPQEEEEEEAAKIPTSEPGVFAVEITNVDTLADYKGEDDEYLTTLESQRRTPESFSNGVYYDPSVLTDRQIKSLTLRSKLDSVYKKAKHTYLDDQIKNQLLENFYNPQGSDGDDFNYTSVEPKVEA